MNNTIYDKRFFKDFEFGESQIKDKQGNVVGNIGEDGCWCFDNGFKVAPERKNKQPQKKKIKLKL